MFCCALLCIHSSFAIISMLTRQLVALLFFVFLVSPDCCVGLNLTMPRVCLQFVIVVFPDHTHYFTYTKNTIISCWPIKSPIKSCILCNFARHCGLQIFLNEPGFSKKLFQEYNVLSYCQTVWIQIRLDILSHLILLQSICKVYQQMKKFISSCKMLRDCVGDTLQSLNSI